MYVCTWFLVLLDVNVAMHTTCTSQPPPNVHSSPPALRNPHIPSHLTIHPIPSPPQPRKPSSLDPLTQHNTPTMYPQHINKYISSSDGCLKSTVSRASRPSGRRIHTRIDRRRQDRNVWLPGDYYLPTRCTRWTCGGLFPDLFLGTMCLSGGWVRSSSSQIRTGRDVGG